MASYTNFIPQNIATEKAIRIVVFNSNGKKIGKMPLGYLTRPNNGEKLYSVGLISDIHVTYNTSYDDLKKALTYFNEIGVDFVGACGDLTSQGTPAQLGEWKKCIDTYSPNTPVYAISGNHESYNDSWGQNGADVVSDLMQTYTGNPLYYSFTKGDDVYIMFGTKGDGEGSLFTTEGLQWLYETLEVNRNKRCFVFQHVRPQNTSGNAFGIYKTDIWGGVEATVFESLMKHYTNCILLHGHSHLKFDLQTKDNKANYTNADGYHSIHIPSLSSPRTGNADGTGRKELYDESEGYVMEVYKDNIVLKGMDFVSMIEIPLAQYCLDTTLKTIEKNTYSDPTGTINV